MVFQDYRYNIWFNNIGHFTKDISLFVNYFFFSINANSSQEGTTREYDTLTCNIQTDRQLIIRVIVTADIDKIEILCNKHSEPETRNE